MLLIGYMWGQKVYPIPYETSKLIGYGLFSLAIYGLSIVVKNWIDPVSLPGIFLNFTFLAGFVLTGFLLERKSLKTFVQ